MKKIFLTVVFLTILSSLLFGIDPVANTLQVKGNVDLTRNQQIYDLIIDEKLFNGDAVESMEDSYAAIRFTDNSSIVKLFPNSILQIRTEKAGDKTNKKSLLKFGEMWAKVEKKTGKFEVETPTTVISVKGTNFLVDVSEDGITDLYTFEGEVLIQNKIDGQSALVGAGQHARTSGEGLIEVAAFDPSEIPVNIDEFIQEEIKPVEIEVEEKEEAPRPTHPIQPAPEMEMPETETPETESSASDSEGPLQMGGGVGAVMIDEQTYTQLRFMPELTLGKFGLGLDIDLLIDSEGNVREEDWDDWKDYLNKIYYMRYGERGDAFYGRFGGFPDYSLAHGLIMKNYSNMLQYPQVRQLGLQLGGQIPKTALEMEAFTSNIAENEILAGRLTIQPLKNVEVPVLNKIKFGVAVVTDRNQYSGLTDSDDDGYYDAFDDFPDNKHFNADTDKDGLPDEADLDLDGDGKIDATDYVFEQHPWMEDFADSLDNDIVQKTNYHYEEDDITAVSVDYEIPLINNKVFALGHYGEAAQILDHNMGFIFPGFYAKFLIFQANLEYRFLQDDFAPAYFDNLYDQQRAVVSGDTVYTKESTLLNYEESHGWYGSLTANLFQFISLTAAYEDMYGTDDYRNKSIWGTLELNPKFIPKLSKAKISYVQKDFDKLTEFKTPNAQVNGQLNYAIGSSTDLVGAYQERYIDFDGSGKIDRKDETVKSMKFGVEFRF